MRRFFLFSLLLVFSQGKNLNLTRKILIVSFDGFAQHYLDNPDLQPILPNLLKFRSQGVFTESIQNVFTGETFPNHFAMVTGLYPESHGIVSNIFYDPELGAEFTSKKYGHPGRHDLDSALFWRAEPIWVTARRLGLAKTATSMWPGDRATYQPGDIKANMFRADFSASVPFLERLDEVINWLTNDSADLALIFHFEPDDVGHFQGISGPAIERELGKIDKILGYLVERIEDVGLRDRLDLVICSDHGMAKINGQVYLDKFLNLTETLERISRFGAHADLWPREGYEDFVFDTLNKAAAESHDAFAVYRRKNFPEHLHYSNNQRIAPIIVLGKGYFIAPNIYNNAQAIDYHGVHGWDPSLPMQQPFFMAQGPSFKSGGYNATLTTIGMKTKDIYAVIAQLLDADTTLLPPNNASFSVITDLFKIN